MHTSVKGCHAQGAQLEPALGSARFLRLVAELLLATQALAVLLARAGAAAFPDLLGPQYHSACAVGFSGVLFALKARTTSALGGSTHSLCVFPAAAVRRRSGAPSESSSCRGSRAAAPVLQSRRSCARNFSSVLCMGVRHSAVRIDGPNLYSPHYWELDVFSQQYLRTLPCNSSHMLQ